MASAELILLVNDIPDHAERYKTTLEQHGFQVRLARSGQEALDLVRHTIPKCAIIDLRLPDMSGWDLCRELKERPKARHTRIVVLTPEVSAVCAADSAKVGCHAWLAHPTIADDIAQTVRQVLNLEVDEPVSVDEALIGLTPCVACGSDRVRATLRVGRVQYYCCQACGLCWRVETLRPDA